MTNTTMANNSNSTTMTRDDLVLEKFVNTPSFAAIGKFYESKFGCRSLNTTVMSIIMRKETSHAFFGAKSNIIEFSTGEKKVFTKRGIALKFHAEPGMKMKFGNYTVSFENVIGVMAAKDAINYAAVASSNETIVAAGDWSVIYWGKPVSSDNNWKDEFIYEFICVKAGSKPSTATVSNNKKVVKETVKATKETKTVKAEKADTVIEVSASDVEELVTKWNRNTAANKKVAAEK